MNDFRAQLARTCMQDDPPPCASVCPFGLDIRAFIGHMKRGAFSAAFRLYRDAVAFPGIVSQLCGQPCRGACVFAEKGGPIALRDLEAAAIAHAPNIRPNNYNLPKRTQRIAVIGAGPCGLACALRLASKKYEVVIFEKEERVGGSLWSLLPEAVFMPELERQFMYEKVDFRLDQEITNLSQVQAGAVYVSTGAGGDCFGLELSGRGACASRRDGVFLGGELAGRTVMEAIADGLLAAKAIERYLKVGGMNEPFRDFSTRFIATCNHCGLCKQVCPVSLDTGTYLLDSHRRMVEEEAMPWAYHEFWLRDMEFSNGEASLLLDPDGNGNPKYLFFPGCRLGGSDPRLVLDSFRTLLEHEPESALYLGCCGAPAEWAGEEKLHSETVEEFARVWEDLGRPTVVFACLNCRQELARHLPRAEGMSLYELLDSWDLPVFQSGAGQTAAVFDPCPSRDFPETQRAVRSLARKAGFHLDALPLEGEYAQCCGWGGQVEIANPKYAQGWPKTGLRPVLFRRRSPLSCLRTSLPLRGAGEGTGGRGGDGAGGQVRRSVLQDWITARTGCTSREELDRWQQGRLREALDCAKENSPFYREHLRAVRPKDICTREDLARIPFTTADQLRADPQRWLCCGGAEVERVVTLKTSGTTASPKRIFFRREDQERMVDFFAHGMGELVFTTLDRRAMPFLRYRTGDMGRLPQTRNMPAARWRRREVLSRSASVPKPLPDLPEPGCRSGACWRGVFDVHKTTSVCPVCLKRVPAVRVEREGRCYLEKTCPEHGAFSALVWQGSEALEDWTGPREETGAEEGLRCPEDCGLCGKHLRNTCCTLLEVTDRCDLRCRFCFADNSQTQDPPLERVKGWIDDIVRQTGGTLLQLSGGEPTLRDDLPEIVTHAKKAGCPYVQLNTNGLRLAEDPAYLHTLARAGLDIVFLQFDGITEAVYRALRGRELLGAKGAAVMACAEESVGVVLVPTLVPGVNTDQVGDIIRFGLAWSPTVRGVHFQPVSYFGRVPALPGDGERYTMGQLLDDIVGQTGGLIPRESLVPSACDHPLCGLHSGGNL